MGEAGQKERWVFDRPCAEVRKLADRIREPAILVKVCASETEVEPLLGQGWTFGTSRAFMASALEAVPPLMADGYPVSVVAEPWGYCAIASTGDGTVAGRAGLLLEGNMAVIDRLVVGERHRGRGLGSAIVAALHNEAGRRGATRGALVATMAGRRIYERFGWTAISDYTTAEFLG